ncbi:MAG: hypothetical protein ACOVQX_05205 [Legionella sp.]
MLGLFTIKPILVHEQSLSQQRPLKPLQLEKTSFDQRQADKLFNIQKATLKAKKNKANWQLIELKVNGAITVQHDIELNIDELQKQVERPLVYQQTTDLKNNTFYDQFFSSQQAKNIPPLQLDADANYLSSSKLSPYPVNDWKKNT